MENLIKKYLTEEEIKAHTLGQQEKIARFRAKKHEPFVNTVAKSVAESLPKLSLEEQRALRAKEFEQEKFKKTMEIRKRWDVLRCHMPEKFHRAKLEPVEVNGVKSPNQSRVIGELFAKGVEAVPKNLLFTGSSGIGKTHLSVALCNRYIYRGIGCRFIQDADYVKLVKTDLDYAKQFETCDVLVLDDIAGDGGYGRLAWASDSTYVRNLIYDRAERGLVTIVSTNFSTSELRKYLGERVWSRFTSDFTEGENFAYVDFGVAAGLRGVA